MEDQNRDWQPKEARQDWHAKDGNVGAEDLDENNQLLKEEFKLNVERYFSELTGRRMPPTLACVLALKIAAGVADPPITPSEVTTSLTNLKQATHGTDAAPRPELEAAISAVTSLFTSPDALGAAFWLESQQAMAIDNPSPNSNSTENYGKNSGSASLNSTGNFGKSGSARIAAANQPDSPAAGSKGAVVGQWRNSLATGTRVAAALSTIDVEALDEMYACIRDLRISEVADALCSSSSVLCRRIKLVASTPPANPGAARQITSVLLNPLLEEVEFHSVTAQVADAAMSLMPEQLSALEDELAGLNKHHMHRVITTLQQYITLTLYREQTVTSGVESVTKLLALLAAANDRSQVVSYVEFYNDAVNNEDFNIKEDYRRWKNPIKYSFSFCKYPAVYDPGSKARVLQMENQMEQYSELQGSLMTGIFSGQGNLSDVCPFLVLKVRRGPNLVQDTLSQITLAKNRKSLKKPLKVKFVGEEGVDEGGVQKEFFQLLLRQLFNPEYGMFLYDERTCLHWFRPSRLDMDMEFELIGILIGLAIYNAHLLEFQFPRMVYKKLMGVAVNLDDMDELQPEVTASLRKLMEYEGNFEDMGLFFAVETEVGFGEMETIELIPNGTSVPVTADNCAQYVSLYVEHTLNTSIHRQFSAFRDGFLKLCGGPALSWFRPEELETLVCGNQSLDLKELEAATLYDDGLTKDSELVHWFWDVVHALPQHLQRRLLFFITGSDRVPIRGLGHLNPPLVISRAGPHSSRLPSAHTCFNHLLLPAYESREYLTDRLALAIENAEGFGMI